MKKIVKKIYLWVVIILYNVFSYIYATDGLEIQLATKIQKSKFDYIQYNYNPISKKLYIVAIIGMILTGVVFLVGSTYRTYIIINNHTKKEEAKWKNIFKTAAFLVVYILILHFCREFFVNSCMLIGEEM